MSIFKKFLILMFFATGLSFSAHAQEDSAVSFAEKFHNNDKSGCQTRMSLQFTALDSYKRGVSAEQLAGMRAFVPIFENMYDRIRKDGESKTRIAVMDEYEKCVRDAPANENLSTEYDLIQQHGACAQLNGVVTDTLRSIKARRSASSVAKKYERSSIDLSDTAFGDMPNPELLVIAQLYRLNDIKGYDAAIEGASMILASCAY